MKLIKKLQYSFFKELFQTRLKKGMSFLDTYISKIHQELCLNHCIYRESCVTVVPNNDLTLKNTTRNLFAKLSHNYRERLGQPTQPYSLFDLNGLSEWSDFILYLIRSCACYQLLLQKSLKTYQNPYLP